MKKTNSTTLPNDNFRAQGRSRPSLRGSRPFCLGRNLRQIPQITIWSCCLALLAAFDVSALTYSEDVNINFTFNPSLTVSLSSPDIIINNLTPGTSSDSNIIDINVATNNVAGYTLFGTVGNSTDTSPSHNTTSLVHSSNGSTFTSLSTNDNVTSLSDFNDNQWGYSYSLDNGTTWSNYSGLPLYSTTGTILKDKHIPGDDSLKFKIAAKSSTTQPSGTYTNIINFTTTANVQDFYFMQDFTNQLCKTLATDNNYTVYDYRDGNDYTVRYINDSCWMTQNLRFTGNKLNSATSNVAPEYTSSNPLTIEWYDLKEDGAEGGKCWGDATPSGDGYSHACKHSPNLTDDSGVLESYTPDQIGVWYNFAGVSAMTITGTNNNDTLAYDICPAGWRIPHGTNTMPGRDLNKLIGNTISGYQNATLGLTAFSAVGSGYYSNGLYGRKDWAWWWNATLSHGPARVALGYNGLNDTFMGDSGSNRNEGLSVRCLTDDE